MALCCPCDCVPEKNEQLTEENKTIQLQLLEQRQQLEELKDRLKFYSRVRCFDYCINAVS